jgi:hypothetical protein
VTDGIDQEIGAEPAMLKQADLRLQEDGVARRFASSQIPGRFAYVATAGTPWVQLA